VVERHLQHPVRPAAPPDPLSPDGPSASARDAARTGLYVHVPFCAVRCTYCHFATAVFEHGLLDRWLGAIEREAALRAPAAAGTAFSSVFFGGGTPSSISARHFTRLWDALRRNYTIAPGAEVTLEANPESVRPALLDAWAAAGVNRLSLGAQSFEPDALRVLGRVHDENRPGEALALARRHGFERLSLDLMYGWPGHSLPAFERSLDTALALGVEHLSAYAFIPDHGNPLGDAVLEGRAQVVDDETQASMYGTFLARAAAAGLHPYETSNVSRPGAEARHNLVYWLRRDYLGLGPSAHSLWAGERWGNVRDTAPWAAVLEGGALPDVARERESATSVAEEVVMLALRLATGLRPKDYTPLTWAAVAARFGEALSGAVAAGRLQRTDEGWRVAPDKRFVADDSIAWVAARGRD
jgi:putative oxygen-independent coproporphyrinogen III oxidase